MRLRLLIAVVLFLSNGIALFASCKKPTISNAVATPDKTGQQFTVTWTTDVPADSLVLFGTPNPGTPTEVTDAGGATSHSVTIKDLFPSTLYGWGIRSQAINSGVACGTGYFAFYHSSVTTSAPPAGAFTYKVSPVGPTYVTQGYGMYFQIRLVPLTGTYSAHSLTMVLSGLPEFTSLRWSDSQLWKMDPDGVSTAAVPNDTVAMYGFNHKEVYVETNVGGTTPAGSYTIRITVSGEGGPTQVATWPLHVVPSSAPFSGVPLQYGKPSSYPPIPGLSTYTSSANTYGLQNCAQDQDTTSRIIRPNNLAYLTPVGPSTTYGAWFYDGVMVYYNVENLLNNGNNWAQCRANVKQVYRDNYALIKPIQTFMTFSQGYYMDYLKTADPADVSVINKFNGETYSPSRGVYVDVSYLQREVAYVLRNETHGVALGQNVPFFGQPSSFVRDYAEDHVLGMIDQMCLSQNAQYWTNFMTGLQAEALIEYYTLVTKDPRIPPALSCLADYLYKNQWQALNTGSFPYDKLQWQMKESYANGATSCMNTLNNLISPMYAWLFMMTGDPTYQAEGDAIFNHGALFDCAPLPTGPKAYLTFPYASDGKNFSQQYYWGTHYVEWRSSPVTEKASPAASPTGLAALVE